MPQDAELAKVAESLADAELAQESGQAIAAVLLDCAKCYERIPLEEMRIEAIQRGFPQELANLAVDMYKRA